MYDVGVPTRWGGVSHTEKRSSRAAGLWITAATVAVAVVLFLFGLRMIWTAVQR